MKTERSGKFRRRLVGRSATIFATLAVLATGSTACGGGSDDVPDPSRTGGKPGLFKPPPVGPYDEIPDGLDDETDRPLIDLLQTNSDYSDYVSLLQVAGIAGDLVMKDSLTVFAPLNDAIEAQSGQLDEYLAPEDLKSVQDAFANGVLPEIDDPDRLADLLRRGMITGVLAPDQMVAGMQLEPLEGDVLTLSGSDNEFRVDGIPFDSGAGKLGVNGAFYPTEGLIGL